MKTKFFIFLSLLILMITYVGWIFYISEPKYVDNPTEWSDNDGNWIEKYQIVSYQNGLNYSSLGMVIQIDTVSFQNQYALVKNLDGRGLTNYTKILLNTETPAYSIVGTGTFYHKVNSLIGFNIMMVTVIFVMIFCVIIFFTLIITLRDMLGSDFEFFWE